MKKKSILFLEPAGHKANVFANYMKLPLTGILYLGTILHNAGYEVSILSENLLPKRIDPFEIKADIFCITSLTVSANRARTLAGQLKRIYPESKVIVGGIHATLMPETFEGVADQIVLGEAEDIIIDVIEGKFSDYIVHGAPIQDLDALPFINYSLLEGYRRMPIIPIITSRGCPFNCEFCTVTKIFGRRFRMQSAERVLAEVKSALSYFTVKSVFFYDDNFTADRERIDKICQLIVDHEIDFHWNAQVRTDIAKEPELVEKMVQAHCDRVFVGFESIDNDALAALHKSQTREDVEHSIRTLHRYGIKVHGMFMFGEDHDTVENIRNTATFAIENDIDTVQFMVLTPIPGTKIYERFDEQNRLYHKNWDYYDGMYAVFQPKNMSGMTLQLETIRAYKKFYSLRRTVKDSLYFLYHICIDALVWNFKQVHRYNVDTLFIKVASKLIVKRYASFFNKAYFKFLKEKDV